jgi:hypothetical protein
MDATLHRIRADFKDFMHSRKLTYRFIGKGWDGRANKSRAFKLQSRLSHQDVRRNAFAPRANRVEFARTRIAKGHERIRLVNSCAAHWMVAKVKVSPRSGRVAGKSAAAPTGLRFFGMGRRRGDGEEVARGRPRRKRRLPACLKKLVFALGWRRRPGSAGTRATDFRIAISSSGRALPRRCAGN